MKAGLVTFRLGTGLYAIAPEAVREVLTRFSVTALPGLPPHVRGMMNLRGSIIAVLDPRILLGLRFEEEAASALIVQGHIPGAVGAPHTGQDGRTVALLVDEIGDIIPSESYRVGPVPGNLPQRLTRFIQGVAERGDNSIAVLDLDRVLVARSGDELEGD